MLLTVIIFFNVANLSLLSAAVPGPESPLANRPTAVVLVIFAQIVVPLFLEISVWLTSGLTMGAL